MDHWVVMLLFCSSRIVHPYRRNQPWFQVYTSVCPRGARRENHVVWLAYCTAHWIGALWMHGRYWYEGVSQVKVRIVTTAIFVKYFCNTFFCFVLCIHLVPSCSSLLMFVSNFSVYLIIKLMYLFTLLVKTWISLFILFIYYLFVNYTVSKNSDFVIYLSTYLFVCLFIYMNCPISVNT